MLRYLMYNGMNRIGGDGWRARPKCGRSWVRAPIG